LCLANFQLSLWDASFGTLLPMTSGNDNEMSSVTVAKMRHGGLELQFILTNCKKQPLEANAVHSRQVNPKSFMKNKLHYLFIMLALFASIHQSAAISTTVFPIETNPAVFEFGSGISFDGTNYLVEGLTGSNWSAGTNVNVQLVSPSGALIGSPINIGGGVSVQSMGLLAFGQTNYLVVWSDSTVSSGVDMFGQFVSRTGATVGPAFNLLASQGSYGFQTVKALSSDGTNFLVVWQDGNDKYFYGQLVTPAGTLSGSAFLISGQQGNAPSAAVTFGTTNYLVVWQSQNGSIGNTNQAYGEFVSRSGATGSAFQIGQTSSMDGNTVDGLVVAFGGTNYLALWNLVSTPGNGGPTTNWQIYGRIVSQTGTFPGNEIALLTNGDDAGPSLAFDGANYLLTHGSYSNTTNSARNLYCQFLDPSANLVGAQFTPFTAQGTNRPLFAFNGILFDGTRFVVAGSLGTVQINSEVFGAFISASTTPPTLAPTGTLAGTQFPLLLTGTPGINYAIQTTTNLAMSNWTALTTNSPTNGTFSFTDTSATNKSRFYRAMKQ
jgi:hypothetical protein